MSAINDNYLRLEQRYLFSEVAARVSAFCGKNPSATVIRMGIGDVTQPIAPAVAQAMHRAVDQLKVRPQHLLIDGNRFNPYPGIPHTTVVKGDGKYMSIAAASILAKTYRDDFMLKIHEEYPQYHWNQNKGYPAPIHREAIRQYGTTPYHRMSFNLLGSPQLELDFG